MLGTVYEKIARIFDLPYTGLAIHDYSSKSAELHRIITNANPDAQTLLDVGCGTGAHLAELQQWFTVEGVDISPGYVAAVEVVALQAHRG